LTEQEISGLAEELNPDPRLQIRCCDYASLFVILAWSLCRLDRTTGLFGSGVGVPSRCPHPVVRYGNAKFAASSMLPGLCTLLLVGKRRAGGCDPQTIK
jgi:hypothetical protein